MQEERNPEMDEDVEGLKKLNDSDDEVEAHRFTHAEEEAEEPGLKKRNKPGDPGWRFGADDPNWRF